jgi:hypothetical protein
MMCFSVAQIILCVFMLNSPTVFSVKDVTEAVSVWRVGRDSASMIDAEFESWVQSRGGVLLEFVDAVRGGLCHEASLVYVAPDAYGGHGLFAAVDLPKHALVGEYVGALQRGVCALSDPYLMCYPSAPGALYLSGKDAGSLMRFVNHAPLGDPANNCKCVAILVDGAYHLCLVTTCAVAARVEFAFDYGPVYWTRQRSTCKTSTPAPSTLASDTLLEANEAN